MWPWAPLLLALPLLMSACDSEEPVLQGVPAEPLLSSPEEAAPAGLTASEGEDPAELPRPEAAAVYHKASDVYVDVAWLGGKEFAEVRDLDGARLEHALRGVDHEVTYQHGVEHVTDIVKSGGAEAGVLIRPVTVAEIQRTADEGLLMPPKSTFFTPKLRTGPVIRPLDLR